MTASGGFEVVLHGVGEVAALTSAFLWAGASLLFSRAGAGVPTLLLNLIKTVLAFVGLGLTLRLQTGYFVPVSLEGSALFWVGLSGVIGLAVGDSFFFLSLTLLGAKRSLILWALTPAVTAGLAAWVLAEAVETYFLTGLVMTTIGVGVVLLERLPPGHAAEMSPRTVALGGAAGLMAVLCQAGGTVTAKLGGGGLSGLQLSVVRLLFGTVAMLVPGLIALRRSSLHPPKSAFVQIGLATFLGTYLGIWMSMVAVQNAPAGVVATLQSTSPIFVLPLARLFLAEAVSFRALAGALLAVSGVALVTLPGL